MGRWLCVLVFCKEPIQQTREASQGIRSLRAPPRANEERAESTGQTGSATREVEVKMVELGVAWATHFWPQNLGESSTSPCLAQAEHTMRAAKHEFGCMVLVCSSF